MKQIKLTEVLENGKIRSYFCKNLSHYIFFFVFVFVFFIIWVNQNFPRPLQSKILPEQSELKNPWLRPHLNNQNLGPPPVRFLEAPEEHMSSLLVLTAKVSIDAAIPARG